MKNASLWLGGPEKQGSDPLATSVHPLPTEGESREQHEAHGPSRPPAAPTSVNPRTARERPVAVATKLSCRAGKRQETCFALMRCRGVRNLAIVIASLLIAGCGSSSSPNTNAAANGGDVALAARGRASLIATFKDTPWRLPPVESLRCVDDRRSGNAGDISDEPEIYCSLNSSAMKYLLRRLDRGLGADVTAGESSCISRKITRDQVAALLSAQLGVGVDDLPAADAKFDAQLASVIRNCRNN